MKLSVRMTACAAAAACLSSGAWAHHSNAMFDRTKVIKLQGTVKDYQWTNPHTWIELDVPTAKGPVHYSIEGPSPSILRRKGWKFDSLHAGDKVALSMHPLKTGEMGGEIMSVTANGTTLEYEGPAANGGGQ